MASKKRGAPEKAPGGLTEVLFVRVDRRTLDRLDRMASERGRKAGVQMSRSDLVRLLIAGVG